MSVIFRPPGQHYCGPNRYGFRLDYCFDAPGTVRGCECGKFWVAFKDERDWGYMGVKWRPEGWFARWRRIKSAQRGGETAQEEQA